MKITKITIIAERPKDIPKDWLIFNAPRPLLGHKEWQGDFRHGIFYAAIDPNNLETKIWIKKNYWLDGWIVKYITKEKAIQKIKKFYYKEYPKCHSTIEDLNEVMLIDAFYQKFHKEETEL